MAAAESCTGGLLTSRLTDVPGSSRYVGTSVVAYANDAKTALLGVAPALLEAHGAVSEPVAVAMAEGIRARAGADLGLGVTGIAGPTGGSPEKPVGTVAVALASAAGTQRPYVPLLRRTRIREVSGLAGGAGHGSPALDVGAGFSRPGRLQKRCRLCRLMLPAHSATLTLRGNHSARRDTRGRRLGDGARRPPGAGGARCLPLGTRRVPGG